MVKDKYGLKEEMEKRLNDRELDIIYGRYGLVSDRKTLQELASIYNLTRERVRQKEQKALEKMSAYFNSDLVNTEFIKALFEDAENVTPLDYIDNLSDIYKNSGIAALMAKLQPEVFSVFNSEMLSRSFFILSNNKEGLNASMNETVACLNMQKGYVKISELCNFTHCPKQIVLNLRNIALDGDYIAIKTNDNIFREMDTITIIEGIIRDYGRPMTITDIKATTDLTIGQVRHAVEKSRRIINVGPSFYALEEMGYLRGDIKDVIYYYLEKAREPLSLTQIVNLVEKQRMYKKGSIIAALRLDDRIQEVEDHFFVLRKWGYENVVKHKKTNYKINTRNAIEKIFLEEEGFLSARDIKERIINEFGENASNKRITIIAALEQLVMQGKLVKMKKGYSSYFKRTTI
jgi:hypothetical protein